MSDNLLYTPGAGATLATDDIGGVHHQRVKLSLGADGAATDAPGDGTYGIDVDITRSVAIAVTDNSGSLTVDDGGSTISVDDGGGALTVDSTQLPSALVSGRLDVNIGACSGTVTATSAQGTAAANSGAWPVKVSDGTDTVGITTVSGAKALKVDVVQSAAGQADKSAFTEGSGRVTVSGAVYNDTISSDPAEDNAAALRITAKRGLHVNVRNASGTELATSGNPLRVDPTGTTAQPITDNSGSLTIDVNGTAVSETNPLYVQATKLKKTPVRKQITYTASQTAQTVWTPASGKKFIVESLIISPTGAGTLSLFDGTDSAANAVFYGTMPASGMPLQIQFPGGHPSSTADNVLRYTTGSGSAGTFTVFGYESD